MYLFTATEFLEVIENKDYTEEIKVIVDQVHRCMKCGAYTLIFDLDNIGLYKLAHALDDNFEGFEFSIATSDNSISWTVDV